MRHRSEAWRKIDGASFDVCVIGGGATGSGCALDAQLRGLSTVLIEAGDFASATSSRSTKLIHGGVRYLQEAVTDLDPGQYNVVKRALRERRIMLDNARFLAHPMEFLVPCYSRWDVVLLRRRRQDLRPHRGQAQLLSQPLSLGRRLAGTMAPAARRRTEGRPSHTRTASSTTRVTALRWCRPSPRRAARR